MMKMRGDDVSPALVHFEVVISEPAETGGSNVLQLYVFFK